jgi:hypothetical protein
MKRFLAILMIALLAISITTFTVLASESTEAMMETTTESAETEASTEPTEAMTEAPTAKPTDAPTEAPTEEQGTPISFGEIFSIGNKVIDFINKHKEAILSGASALASLLLSVIVGKIFKPRLKEITKKTTESYDKLSIKIDEVQEETKKRVDQLCGSVEDNIKKINNMIASYEKERADLHAADATAEIDHEFATMMYHLIMNSNVGMGIKDEVENLYKESEEKINHMIEDAKKERGEHHGTGEHQSANG